MRILLILLGIFLFFVSPTPINSSENWVIENFKSEIDLLQDGKVRVVEEVAADFGSLQKHGIYRDIPFVYTLADGGKLYSKIEVQTVTSNGASIPYETYRIDSYERIKIGDPDRTVSGKQTYKITKRLVCETLLIFPLDIIVYVTKNVWFVSSFEDAWGFVLKIDELKERGNYLIVLGEELFEQDSHAQRYEVAHEIGHVILKHRNAIT